MTNFLYNLKGQVSILNLLFLLLLLAFILYKYQKKKGAIFFTVISVILFFLCATPYLPNYLADRLERKFKPFNLLENQLDTGIVLIHVLGSGNNLDKRLPPNAQLGLTGLGRLSEAIRIHRQIKNSIIVCSGYSSRGGETQAQVTKRAAIVLGVEENKLATLNLPSTTKEEARELRKFYPASSKLIIVTDAMHMPRAIHFFKEEGFNPLAAPTNYYVHEGPHQDTTRFWPSTGNIFLMNLVIHEYLGYLKGAIFN